LVRGWVYCWEMLVLIRTFSLGICLAITSVHGLDIDQKFPSFETSPDQLRGEKYVEVSEWIQSKSEVAAPEWLDVEQKHSWNPPLNIIDVGLHIESLHRLNHQDQTFGFTGTLWHQWSNKLLGWDGGDLGNPAENWFFNSVDTYDFYEATGEPYQSNGKYSVTLTIDGRLKSNLDYRLYPFDSQQLVVEMELGSDAYEILISAKDAPTVYKNFNRITDYEVQKITTENLVKIHPTDYGVPDYLVGETFANGYVRTTIALKRIYLNSFFDYILPLLTVTALLLVNASRLSTDKGVKLSLPPAALLSIIFIQQFTDQQIPNLSYLTFLDYLYLFAYTLVFVCFFEAAIFRYENDMSASEQRIFTRGRMICKKTMIGIFLLGPPISWFLASN